MLLWQESHYLETGSWQWVDTGTGKLADPPSLESNHLIRALCDIKCLGIQLVCPVIRVSSSTLQVLCQFGFNSGSNMALRSTSIHCVCYLPTWCIQVFQEHDSSVNSICWAPAEFGLCLACGSSDGTISVLTQKVDGAWEKAKINPAHPVGVTAVSWAPAAAPGSLVGEIAPPVQKLASAGCDNTIKVWKYTGGNWRLDCFPPLSKHTDWVRDVAWAPNLGLLKSTIASASQDGTVVIWTQVWICCI